MTGFTILPVAGATLALAFLSAAPVAAQGFDDPESVTAPERLVNLDLPSPLAERALSLRADVRVFREDEDNTYTTLQAGYGLAPNCSLTVRGVIAQKKLFTRGKLAIRHGGSDFEALLRFHSPEEPDASFSLGISSAGTPAQDSTYLTGQASAACSLGSIARLYLNPRLVAIENNVLTGIGAGVRFRFGSALELVGDYTAMTSGRNTRSRNNGELLRRDVWGAAVRYSPQGASGGFQLELGVTNGLGGTTGFSLTPSLGGTAGAYAAVAWRR